MPGQLGLFYATSGCDEIRIVFVFNMLDKNRQVISCLNEIKLTPKWANTSHIFESQGRLDHAELTFVPTQKITQARHT